MVLIPFIFDLTVADDSPSSIPEKAKFCFVCGTEYKNDEANFCSKCGNPRGHLNSDDQPTVKPSPSEPAQSEIIPADTTQPQIYDQNQAFNQNQSVYSSKLKQPTQENKPSYFYDQIVPLQTKLLGREEYIILAGLTICGVISHILRIFLLFNNFPSLLEILFAIPYYIGFALLILIIKKKHYIDRGIDYKFEMDYYDYMVTIVLSTFFLSYFNPRGKINYENSSIPESGMIPVSTKFGLTYQEIDRESYIKQKITSSLYLKLSFIAVILSIALFGLYLYSTLSALIITNRLMSAFTGGFVIIEIAPIFGIHNESSQLAGRIRTLLVFFLGLVSTVFALFGDRFLTAVLSQI